MPSSALSFGDQLPGELTLEDKLAGHVYKARLRREGRAVAVRVLHPHSPELITDVLALAEAASRVRHPALAIVEQVGRLEDGGCFIATEFVAGQSLDVWADSIGIPPLPQVVDLMRRLCLGLQAALRAGVVHDALNPRNIRVLSAANDTGLRTPMKVLDLGVVSLCFDHLRDPLAQRYMAPEQLAVFAGPELPSTFRCSATMNVYSCGTLLYYLTTGGPPFTGANASELLAAQQGGRLVPPDRINPMIPAALNAVIVRALALDPSERFVSVSELGEALAALSGSLAPPRAGSDAPEVSVEAADPLQDGPPTFKSPRLLTAVHSQDTQPPPSFDTDTSARMNVPGALGKTSRMRSASDDTPTLPPAPMPLTAAEEGVSGVSPIGLFSSSPPFDRRSSAPPLSPASQRPSQRPRVLLRSESPPSTAIRVSSDSMALVPHRPQAKAVHEARPARARIQRVWPLLVPLAAAVLVLGFLAARFRSATGAGTASPRATAAGGSAETALQARATSARTPQLDLPERAALAAAEAPRTGATDEPADTAPRANTRGSWRSREAHSRTRSSTDKTRSSNGGANEASAAPEPAASSAPKPDAPAPEDVTELALEPIPTTKTAATPGSSSPPEAGLQPTPISSGSAPGGVSTVSLTANLEISGFSVRGSLPSAPVKRSVERLRGSFEACYKRAAQAAGHNGFSELIVEVTLDERGRPSAPRVHGGLLPRLDACVADAVSKLICEKAPDTGTVIASWKLKFTP